MLDGLEFIDTKPIKHKITNTPLNNKYLASVYNKNETTLNI